MNLSCLPRRGGGHLQKECKAAARVAAQSGGRRGSVALPALCFLNGEPTWEWEQLMDWTIVDLDNGLAKLAVSGRMDIQGVFTIDPVFEKIAIEKANVIADISAVPFIASLGLRTLVRSCKTLAAKGGNLVLLGAQPEVERVLQTSGVSTIIPLASDMDEAQAILLR
jgi:anti-anti-sigma factor